MPSGFSKLYAVIRDHLGLNLDSIDGRLFRKLFVKGASSSMEACQGCHKK